MIGHTFTGVSGSFVAHHCGFEGRPHPHHWEVKAWWTPRVPHDARNYRANLDRLLGSWNGRHLPPYLQSGEEIAAWIGRFLGCAEVIVSRPDERIYARWVAA
jgi:hypothetical protein